jgi:signal transduction histidine kinase
MARPIAVAIALRALRVTLFGLALGVLFGLTFAGNFFKVLVFTLCISVGCWVFVDAGRFVAARVLQRNPAARARGWPGWPGMIAAIVVGSLAGFSLGSMVAGWLLGVETPTVFNDPGSSLRSLLISATIGVIASYVFWSRAQIAASEARAEQARRASAEQQLRLLQSQLEPHMLFNTLANLRVLIGTDPARAQTMLDALIDFLRATLAASREPTHALSAEFDRCADYLALMKVRMGPRLEVDLSLPDELAALPVPTLLLQPLVENAIKHGLEPKVDGGRVGLRAMRDGTQLVLQVRDTGLGPDQPRAADPYSGFGLTQVRERLATLHGAAASLTLEADPAGGTVATIRLPLPTPA